jgi:hypothetical protein
MTNSNWQQMLIAAGANEASLLCFRHRRAQVEYRKRGQVIKRIELSYLRPIQIED